MLIRTLLLVCMIVPISACQNNTPSERWAQADYGVYDAALSADGRYALIATVDHNATLWDLQENTLQHTWQHKQDTTKSIVKVALSADGQIALTAEHQDFALWHVPSGNMLRYISMPTNMTSIALSTQGRFALIALLSNDVRYVDLQSGETVAILRHNEGVNAVALSSDNRYALTGSDDKIARLWDITTQEVVQTWSHSKAVKYVALSPNNGFALTQAGQFETLLWDIKKGAQKHQLTLRGLFLHRIQPAHMSVSSAVFSADERQLLTGSAPSLLRLWDIETGKVTRSWSLPKRTFWKPPGSIIYALAFDNQKHIISESSDGMGYAFALP